PLGPGVGDVLPQVPPVGVDDLFLLRDRVVDLLRLVAGAAEAAAGAGRVVERAAVVVAHLDEDEVAGLRGGEDPVPPPLGDERPAAAAADRVVLDLDLRRVEERGDRVAPALLPPGAGPHRRVADDEQGGPRRLARGREADPEGRGDDDQPAEEHGGAPGSAAVSAAEL